MQSKTARPEMELVPVEAVVKTTCPYCGVGCGVLAELSADAVGVRGDPKHPSNFGRLCSKGAALAETLGTETRLLEPEIGGRAASWDEALDLVAARFVETIAAHGPESTAFYVSGQLLTEDYYVANKLMKGFIGAANIDTNSRLCMASAVAGHRRAFGADVVPGNYRDLELADLIVLVGSNLAWCHPVLYQRIEAAKAMRPKMQIVLVDPRRTATAELADLHLPIKSDGDVALFAGLLAYLAQQRQIDFAYVVAHTNGFDAALGAACDITLQAVTAQTGLAPELILAFYRLFARTEKVVTVFSQGINQSASGTDKVNAIINCHLATGRIGKPGAGPFSITGQPNAMGGREVGGFANALAAHMDIENPVPRDRVQRFWASPRMAERPGLKAIDLFRAVADGRVKALWIMGTNPVDSMPDAAFVEQALRDCPFVVVSDVVRETDTVRHALVKLPAAAWGEKDGMVTNSERRMSRQRPFRRPAGEARPDWWIICEVAKRMGFGKAFAYRSPAEIFAEHAALSAFENDGERAFDIGALANITREEYDRLAPLQWPQPTGSGESESRFFASGRYFTRDGKARFVPVQPPARARVDARFPFVLNTGRIRDHWHTMTRTGSSPRLSRHLAEPYAEIHPRDAQRLGIGEAGILRIANPQGAILVRALLSPRQSCGNIFVPMHWSDQFAAAARVDRLVPSIIDPHSGQPASKSARVSAERFPAAAYGFAVLRRRPNRIGADYWAIARCAGGWRLELAWKDDLLDWSDLAAALVASSPDAQTLRYHDHAAHQHRFACFDGDRLTGALFVASVPVAVSRDWASDQLLQTHSTQKARLAVIAGRPAPTLPDRGAIICTCFGIGAKEIAAAASRGCGTVESIGQALQAGTNCGSCRSEIRRIINCCQPEAAERRHA